MSEPETEPRRITYAAALNEALSEEMERDEDVMLMGQDISVWGDGGGVFTVTRGLFDKFGAERVRDTPISELAIVGMAVGAASTGLRPVAELMYFDFVTLAMDPLVNQAAKLRYMFGGQVSVPFVLRSNVGASGGKAAQHSQSLETFIMHTPGLKVVMPTTPADAKGMLKTAIRDDNPVVFLEHKLLYFTKGEVPIDLEPIPFGVASILRPGADVTVVATQAVAQAAVKVAEELAARGIDVEVVDLRSLYPLDIDCVIRSLEKTHRLVICHEAPERGGWAGEIAMQVMEKAFDTLDGPIVRVCGANYPVPYSDTLEPVVVPGSGKIAAGIEAALEGVPLDLVLAKAAAG